ncbi:MAG: hypothetical protein EOP06_17340 [Proteobacteria bacterium]|nr:MAG: hypothetical protein EOP06_17340 [Pseudomonadota bacterium]
MRKKSTPEETVPKTQKVRRSRVEFTDAQRAEIFVRDRATCCFSGANLWLLDAPLRPGYQRDWVDHVVPSARGGKATLENGVCASHTFNAKKRNNGADNLYLFECGIPTYTHHEIFGPLAQVQAERLGRLEKLTAADWYFNRAIGQILLGFDYRCRLEHYGEKPSRDDSYWFDRALKRLRKFQKLRDVDLEERGIFWNLGREAEMWLSLRTASDDDALRKIANAIFPVYRANFEAWVIYFDDDTGDQEIALKILQRATRIKGVSEETLSILKQDFSLRYSSDAPAR